MSLNPQVISCGLLAGQVAQRQAILESQDCQKRFWAKDPTLWSDKLAAGVAPWLGWIDVVAKMRPAVAELESFAAGVRADGFERVVLCGMGGSSLAPLVLSKCVADGTGLPLHVLDLTDPSAVLAVGDDLAKTLFIIASKSGSTAEPKFFDAYFWEKVGIGSQFVAITDPGSDLLASANERGFRHSFINYADIGGRYSALSYFGLVPAVLMGIDLTRLLDAAQAIIDESADAMQLGGALGEFGKNGRNKVSFAVSEDLHPLGLWLEQLIAESTGKLGRGLLPVAGELVAKPANYNPDRVFAHLHLGAADPAVAALAAANHPVIDIQLSDVYSIAQEFMRWEIATAVVGIVLEINPFDQPNVQESKDITKRYVAELKQNGRLPEVSGGVRDGDLTWYSDSNADNAKRILSDFLRHFGPNDFLAVMAFTGETSESDAILQRIQNMLKDSLRCATSLGYGPRFLHSTGQFHKGGPNNGFFIQITADHLADAPIPGEGITWGQFVDAQAAGDLEALRQKARQTLRIHVHGDLVAGLNQLHNVVEAWLD